MPTNRTATTQWKRVRKQALQQAQHNGLTNCPICKQYLDYNRSGQPNSPEADHIVPHSTGGQDTLDNVRIICRQCNQKLGAKLGNTKRWTTQTQNNHTNKQPNTKPSAPWAPAAPTPQARPRTTPKTRYTW